MEEDHTGHSKGGVMVYIGEILCHVWAGDWEILALKGWWTNMSCQNENKDKYRLGDCYLIQYQILLIHIIRTVEYPLGRIVKEMLFKVTNIDLLQEEWGRQKAQLTATLERVWTKSIAWTTPTTASLDNSQGHLKTQLKLDPSKKISL